MGVSGLLPLLKSIHRPTELKKFAGETLGVDAYGWLHRGAIACAADLALGKPTRKYVDFAMHRVRMLRHFGVKPYLVFDGDYLPSKAATEGSREKRREDSKKLAMELVKAGKSSQAQLEFQKAIDVTPEMARNLIDELKKMDVSYVVAPYEADAQLVYLERQGLIDGILSEDSDLLVFGCKRLLTKLDQYGNCIEINRRDFCACREVSLTGWTDTDFRRMAILSGCDYLEGINNMGLKTAYRMLRKYKTPERLVRMCQFEGKHRISENYLPRFFQAELTFIHQRVYCPIKKEMVCLTEPEKGKGVEDMPFIGAYVEPALATAVAVGDVNPMTKETIIPAPMPGSKSPKLDAKRRHSQSAEALAANSSSTRTTRPPVKPIDSYFKGHQRIPMGEMDSNCFSVDPERVAALTHNGLVPRVFPLPRPYIEGTSSQPSAARPTRTARSTTSPRLLRRRTEPIQNMLEQLAPANSSDSRRVTMGDSKDPMDDIDALMRGGSQRPPKKVRLCAETDHTETKSEESQKSKFFPKSGSTTQSKKDSFLFSDDLIDEELLNLPDIDEWHNPKPKSIRVFEESQSTGESQGTEATTSTNSQFSKDEEISTTPLSDLSEVEETSQKKSEEATSRRSSLQKFAYSQPSPAPSSQPDTPATAVSQQSSIFTPSTAAPSTAASSITFSAGSSIAASKPTPMLTPLQRLGARALQRKNPPARRTLSPTKSSIQRSPKRSPRKNRLLKSIPVNPSFVPLPKVDLAEVEALNAPCGSEDQLIPDSDGENDDVFYAPDESAQDSRPRALNLSRFVYN